VDSIYEDILDAEEEYHGAFTKFWKKEIEVSNESRKEG